jgi:hypothetical protein
VLAPALPPVLIAPALPPVLAPALPPVLIAPALPPVIAPALPPLPPVPPTVVQTPAWQLWPTKHGVPQVPQFNGSLSVLTQAPLHCICPAGQLPVTQALF